MPRRSSDSAAKSTAWCSICVVMRWAGSRGLIEQDLKNAGEREVVALGSARGEDDLLGTAVEQRGDRSARVLDGRACALAGLMRGAWIAVALEPERPHRLEDLRQDGRGCVGVQIDTHL